MNTGIDHLSTFITPDTAGIVWLTDEDLTYNTPGVYEINYLLDGMLIKTLSKKEDEHKNRPNFLIGDNFGSPFFVSHTIITNTNDLKTVEQHLKLAEPLIEERTTIYLLNRSKNTANYNVQKELAKKFKSYSFELLNI